MPLKAEEGFLFFVFSRTQTQNAVRNKTGAGTFNDKINKTPLSTKQEIVPLKSSTPSLNENDGAEPVDNEFNQSTSKLTEKQVEVIPVKKTSRKKAAMINGQLVKKAAQRKQRSPNSKAELSEDVAKEISSKKATRTKKVAKKAQPKKASTTKTSSKKVTKTGEEVAEKTSPKKTSPNPAKKTSPKKTSTNLAKKTSPKKTSTNPAKKTSPKKTSTNPAKKTSPKKTSTNPAKKTSPKKTSTNPAKKTSPKKTSTNPAKKTSPKKITEAEEVRKKAPLKKATRTKKGASKKVNCTETKEPVGSIHEKEKPRQMIETRYFLECVIIHLLMQL